MKKYLITSIVVLTLIGAVQAQPGVPGQYFQAQVKQSGNLLQFFIRPNPVTNGGSDIANMKFDNFDFFLRYPSAHPLATYGTPVVNTTDFPGLTIAIDETEPYGSEAGFRIVEWRSPFGNSTSTAMTYNAGQEYLVFSVTVTNCSNNFQFAADNINGLPYFLTITRNTAGIGGFGDYTAQGGYGNLTNQLFYNPSPENLSFTPPFSYYQKISSTDYFRSITSGNWNAPATWESSTVSNFGTSLNPAPLSPDASSNDIHIRTGHTVTVTANVSTDQTFVNPGAALVTTGSTLTVIGTAGLTVQSSAAGTGRIGNSTGTINGSVTVERYINTDVVGRKWHLLSGIATTTAQTIRASWQEGGGAPSTPNVGTWLTAPGPPAGYDGVSISHSILTHNAAGPSWGNLAATNSGSINAQRGYMLFVRGDRFAQPPPNALQAPTVLRTTGTINQGTQAAVTVLNASPGYTIMGNPFASPIDLETVLNTANLGQFFQVWDASVPGNFSVGQFRVVQKTGPGVYIATPTTGGNDNTLRYIHSGQAFFLKATGGNANVSFTEAQKTNLVSIVNPSPQGTGDQQIYTELAVVTAGNVETVLDAVRVWYNAAYSTGTTDDLPKMGNFGENISSYRGGNKFIVENRPMITGRDTIFLRSSNLAVNNYRFKINTFDFVQTSLPAFLVDNYLNTSTPIDLSGAISQIDFTVTADAASADPDRFMIVFGASGPLPLSFTSVKATQQSSDIAVEWKVSNQVNIAKYEVEKSTDGINFNRVNTQQMVGANGSDATYAWLDVNAVIGTNYYRIRSIGTSTEVKISQIVKVTIGKNNPDISVYPNPVYNSAASLQFSNQEKGKYMLRLINPLGQAVDNYSLIHQGGSSTQPLHLSNKLAAGAYRLEITDPAGNKTFISLVIAK